MYTNLSEAVETGHQSHLNADIVDAVIQSRRAVRAFLPDEVSREVLVEILDVSRAAPSNSNTQPWNVHVLHGQAKRKLSEAVGQAHAAESEPPLQHMPDPLPDGCREWQEDFGARYYESLGINKVDVGARARATARNFDFFGAPIGLIFTIDSRLKKFSWVDCGIFLQTLMLAARARGFDTCAQVSFARYQVIIARELGLKCGFDVVCGMSLGYADQGSLVNSLGMPRAPVRQFATFLGFDE